MKRRVAFIENGIEKTENILYNNRRQSEMRCTDLDEQMNGTLPPRRRRRNAAQEKAFEEFAAEQLKENHVDDAAQAEPAIAEETKAAPAKKEELFYTQAQAE